MAPPESSCDMSTATLSMPVEGWASDSLFGLVIGALLPLAVSAVREVRHGLAEGDVRVLRDVWTHRLLDIGWSIGNALDAASIHSKLLLWSNGDTSLLVTSQAVAWTAAASARLLGPLPGWTSVTERYPRVVWSLGRLGMAVDHLASLRCDSLVTWSRLHAACWCFAPLRSGCTAQSACWQKTIATSVGPTRAAKLKVATRNWSGAAGFAAAWWGARLVRAERGYLAHRISIGLYTLQAVMVFCTPRIRSRKRRGAAGRRGSKRFNGKRPSKQLEGLRELARVICSGPDGRQIIVAAAFAVASDSVRICADALCLGPLGWRPTELAVYGALGSCAGNTMETASCAKAIEKIGLRNTSLLGAMLATLGATGMVAVSLPLSSTLGLAGTYSSGMAIGRSWLPKIIGSGSIVSTVGVGMLTYVLMDHVLLRAWGGSHRYATQLLFLQNVTPLLGGSREAAAAAYDGVTQLVTLVSPSLWVGIYSQALRVGRQKSAWSPLAHVLLVATILRLCGTIVMSRLVTVEPAHRWETARDRTMRLRHLLDPTAPAGFARVQRTYASIAQQSGLQLVPRPPKPRDRATGRIPATVQQARPWVGQTSLLGHNAVVDGVNEISPSAVHSDEDRAQRG